MVNAVCLGLAGSTSVGSYLNYTELIVVEELELVKDPLNTFFALQLLGRADNVRDFVRRGENEGWVEITLSSGNRSRPVVINRKLKASENSSEWRINGALDVLLAEQQLDSVWYTLVAHVLFMSRCDSATEVCCSCALHVQVCQCH